MKRLSTTIALMLLCIIHAAAQEYQLRGAIQKFVNNKKLVSLNNATLRGYDINNGEKRQWSCIHYLFTLNQTDYMEMEPLIKAFDKDSNDKRTNMALKRNPQKMQYVVKFSDNADAAVIGSDTEERAIFIVSGEERKDMNTVIGIDMHRTIGEVDGDTIRGNIYIIERDHYFKDIATKKEESKQGKEDVFDTDLSDLPENIRRLVFYSRKYEVEAQNFGGEAIVKAVVFVVSDIIQKNDPVEISAAKQIIDFMIMSTRSERPNYPEEYNKPARDNSNTLLNLLSRLDSKTEYSSMKSTPKTFRIDGTIDDELWDIGYYISMSDETMTDPTLNPELIKAEGQTFHYQTELDEIRLGRVRALFKDGTVCSAWIEILFVPGETAELHVHNGYYTLDGTGFYKDWKEASKYFNAPWSVKPEHREKVVLDVLKNNTDKPAFFVYAFKEKHLSTKENLKKAYDLLPNETKQSPYGVFLRRYL